MRLAFVLSKNIARNGESGGKIRQKGPCQRVLFPYDHCRTTNLSSRINPEFFSVPFFSLDHCSFHSNFPLVSTSGEFFLIAARLAQCTSYFTAIKGARACAHPTTSPPVTPDQGNLESLELGPAWILHFLSLDHSFQLTYFLPGSWQMTKFLFDESIGEILAMLQHCTLYCFFRVKSGVPPLTVARAGLLWGLLYGSVFVRVERTPPPTLRYEAYRLSWVVTLWWQKNSHKMLLVI